MSIGSPTLVVQVRRSGHDFEARFTWALTMEKRALVKSSLPIHDLNSEDRSVEALKGGDWSGATGHDLALFTDLYELTMLQAYFEEGMVDEAVFSLFVRRLPPRRNYLLACGLESVLEYLENLTFTHDDITYLASRHQFSERFLDSLRKFRFTGDVYAVSEGMPVFGNEPILEVVAPIPQAQLVETLIMNQVHLQTVLASKAARVVVAAAGRTVVDFGARRIHGTDAALKAARAFYIAGITATSNVLAGRVYGLPLAGTMAHSFVQAHKDEAEAFRAFARLYPDTVLLVDTYDTLAGVRKVIDLAHALGEDFRIRAVRLDSGDLAELSRQARCLLDQAGLHNVGIFASGGLDEDNIAGLVAAGAPIDGFGVGTLMGVSSDAPGLDMAYKLCAYAGEGRLKLSTGKVLLPGRKQVFRIEKDGRAQRDVIARATERLEGRPLLQLVMHKGKRLPPAMRRLSEIRAVAEREIALLPERVRGLEPLKSRYPVEVSEELVAYQAEITRKVAAS
jgi:nicotinate phosphoribosyltransferase